MGCRKLDPYAVMPDQDNIFGCFEGEYKCTFCPGYLIESQFVNSIWSAYSRHKAGFDYPDICDTYTLEPFQKSIDEVNYLIRKAESYELKKASQGT